MGSLEEQIRLFKDATSRKDLAEALDIPLKIISYNLFICPPEKKYTTFEIPKKSGGTRIISAPISGIKHIQRQVARLLLEIYPPKYCVHGYIKEKGIITNAKIHRNKRILVNVDLKDFFPSINYGRVRGLFKAMPFNFNDEVATTLAQICCHGNALPQGAPTSPIVSNYICRRMDNGIARLCKSCKVDYSRYADDLSFSTNLKELPEQIGTIRGNTLILSQELRDIINGNQFAINEDKTRFAYKNNRQEVTGLIVNEKINVCRRYVRHVRAMLHAWEKYGRKEAAREHFEKYNYKHKKPSDIEKAFVEELRGKINYIGQIKKGSEIYYNLYRRMKALDKDSRLILPKKLSLAEETPIIFCEGHSDGTHLRTALEYFKSKGEFVRLNVHFYVWPKSMNVNNTSLLNTCKGRPIVKMDSRLEIFLFDRDDSKCKKEACEGDKPYRDWGNRVYSAVLPVPEHRDFDQICIEHFYTDEVLRIPVEGGFRLYQSNEFDPDTGKHLTAANIYYAAPHGILKSGYPRIIDENVINSDTEKNVALKKMKFANAIANKDEAFKDLSFDNFRPVFELIEKIVRL